MSASPDDHSVDRLLDAEDIAGRLNVPVTWIREATRDGLIPHVRLGRYIRYEWPAILRWLVENRRPGGRLSERRATRIRIPSGSRKA